VADKNDTQTIPVELLLASIGQQIKVDVEGRRRRLEAEIEKRRQRLAELIERRAEVSDLGRAVPADPVLNVVEEPVSGHGLFDTSSQLEDDLSDDWLIEDPSQVASPADEGLGLSDDWTADLPAPAEPESPQGLADSDAPPIEDLADILSDVAALDPGLTDDWEEFT
jgi:hypothetical protein